MSGPGTRGNDELVIGKPLGLGFGQVDDFNSFLFRINFSNPMFRFDVDILHLFKLLGSSNHQFCLILHYIADVVGSFSGAIGYESTLLEHGDFKIRIDSFCSGSCAGASSRTTNDDEPLSV
jgi:hypothetical protein